MGGTTVAQEQVEFYVTPWSTEDMSRKQAVLETDLDTIIIDFLPEIAPNHVGLFIRLAEDGEYDGTTFHRMVKHGIIQGGDPITKNPEESLRYGQGGLGLVADELSDATHVRGTVSAIVIPGTLDSSGAQFFICVVAQPGLDGPHTIWGQVVEGMEVVTKISEAPVDADGRAAQRVTLRSVKIRDRPPQEPLPFSTEIDQVLPRAFTV
mgnify:CR=1 FL=1